MDLHISLAAEKLFQIGPVIVTNSMLATWLTMGILIVMAATTRLSLKFVPGRWQMITELVIGGMYDFFGGVVGHGIKKFFPLLATLFLFILTANWLSLLPGFGSIGIRVIEAGHEVLVPFLRGPTADLNTTFALASISVLAIQFYGLKTLGREYVGRFLNFTNPIYFFVGILEIISEISRLISFAFRLFGNVFAGEVLLAVIAFLIPPIMIYILPLLLPLPFFFLEVFVGFIQALVFSMLTAVFLNIATSNH